MQVFKNFICLQNNLGNNDNVNGISASIRNILELAAPDILKRLLLNTREGFVSIKKSLNNMVEYGIKVK